MTQDNQQYFLYSAPMIHCKNPRNGVLECQHSGNYCRGIPLPYPTLEGESEDPSDWPPADWRETFVCVDCGRVDTFYEKDIGWIDVKKEQSGKYRHETNCFFVELQCAQRGCASLVRFHIEIFDKTENDLRHEIRKGFVGRWQCGHSALAAPHTTYRIHRV